MAWHLLAYMLTVVSVTRTGQKYKGPLWGWKVIVGYRLLVYACGCVFVCISKRKNEMNTYAQVPHHLHDCSGMKRRKEVGGNDSRKNVHYGKCV